jgi:hypothetical protein
MFIKKFMQPIEKYQLIDFFSRYSEVEVGEGIGNRDIWKLVSDIWAISPFLRE